MGGLCERQLVTAPGPVAEKDNLTFQVDLIIDHPPHDDQANAARVTRPGFPL